MPLLKKILKADTREVVVKWTGSGSDTLTLASLISTGQTVTGNKSVEIVAITTSNSDAGVTTITRNSEVTMSINGNYEYYFDDVHGVINENSGYDIVVNLSTVGTLIMRLRKSQGYSIPTI